MAEADFDPERVLGALSEAEVRYVLIGGMAAILHGDAGVTLDLDIAPALDADNLERLAAALRSMGARIRAEGSREGHPFDCSGAFLRNLGQDAVLNLTTQAGDLDLVFKPTGTQGFGDLKRDAISIDAAGVSILVASLADIIRSKAAADREKDRRVLPRLRALLDRRERQTMHSVESRSRTGVRSRPGTCAGSG